MKKGAVKFLCICFALASIFLMPVSAIGDLGDTENYTYTFEGVPVYAPPAYSITETLYPKDICSEEVGKLVDIAVSPDNDVFLLDAQFGRILHLDSSYKLVDIIDSFTINGKTEKMSNPSGISITESILCISDTDNGRVIHYDIATGNAEIIFAPSANNSLVDYDYRPTHAVLDKTGRTLVIAENQTQGLMIFDKEGKFTGYLGATPVKVDLGEMFWRLIASKEQRKRMMEFVPTEYNNIALDDSGFIFATSFADSKVSRLNLGGKNVLKNNGFYDPYGDINLSTTSLKYDAASSIVDVAARGSIYSILDRNNCRVFTYDYNGNLLYIFGSKGSGKGMLSIPVALDYQEDSILIVDQSNNSVKIFSPEAYSNNIRKALECHNVGAYDEEKKLWQGVLSENNNYELAYLYMGKIEYMSGNYSEAMENFEIAKNKEYYSKALHKQQYKTAGSLLLPFCIIAAFSVLIVLIIKKTKDNAFKAFFKRNFEKLNASRPITEIRYALYTLLHPFDGFWCIKAEKRCGVALASGCLVFAVIINIAEKAATPFLFAQSDNKNLLITGFLGIVFLPIIWCVANWAFTTLTDGKGSFRDIFIYTSISLLPRAFTQVIALIVSQFINLDGATALTVIHVIGVLWMCFLLFVGTLTVHQYSAPKTVVSILLFILGIMIILFIMLLSVSLFNKMVQFCTEYIQEFSMRI